MQGRCRQPLLWLDSNGHGKYCTSPARPGALDHFHAGLRYLRQELFTNVMLVPYEQEPQRHFHFIFTQPSITGTESSSHNNFHSSPDVLLLQNQCKTKSNFQERRELYDLESLWTVGAEFDDASRFVEILLLKKKGKEKLDIWSIYGLPWYSFVCLFVQV